MLALAMNENTATANLLAFLKIIIVKSLKKHYQEILRKEYPFQGKHVYQTQDIPRQKSI